MTFYFYFIQKIVAQRTCMKRKDRNNWRTLFSNRLWKGISGNERVYFWLGSICCQGKTELQCLINKQYFEMVLSRLNHCFLLLIVMFIEQYWSRNSFHKLKWWKRYFEKKSQSHGKQFYSFITTIFSHLNIKH